MIRFVAALISCFLVVAFASGASAKKSARRQVSFSPFSGKLTGPLIGMLEVPDILGEIDPKRPRGAKANPDAKPVKLFVLPDPSSTVLFADAKPADFISSEFDDGLLAAVVYEKRKDWYRVATTSGDAWIQAKAAGGPFHKYEDLIAKGPAYMTPEWDQLMYSAADGEPKAAKLSGTHSSAKIMGKKTISGELWYHVRLVKDVCEDDEPGYTDDGWVPAIDDENQIYVWFLARGC